MLAPILITVAVAFIALIVLIATRPDDFCISRSTTMAAPPEIIFAEVNDLHRWEAWSPWAKMDPACKKSYAGAAAGTGAVFSWDGNKKVGAGRMTILESVPGSLIRLRLEFLKPFQATNIAEFTFTREGNQTAVVWSMTGKNNFMSKAFGLFMNCDKMVGGDFEKGLASLKSISEDSAKS